MSLYLHTCMSNGQEILSNGNTDLLNILIIGNFQYCYSLICLDLHFYTDLPVQ